MFHCCTTRKKELVVSFKKSMIPKFAKMKNVEMDVVIKKILDLEFVEKSELIANEELLTTSQ